MGDTTLPSWGGGSHERIDVYPYAEAESHTWTRCPACDTEMVSTCADKDGWVQWCVTPALMKLPLKLDSVRCPTRFEVRDIQEKPARSRMAPNSSFETTTPNSANPDTSLEGGSDVETEWREHDNWQQYIKRVSAAEVQTQELQRLKRIRVLQILPVPSTPYATPPYSPQALPSVVAPMSPSRGAAPMQYTYPSPTSPAHRPLPATSIIAPNAHLQHYPGHPPPIVWDVRQPTTYAQNAHRQLIDQRMLASSPAVPELILHFAMLPAPAPIRVVAADRRAVTIGEVLAAIYRVLDAPMDAALGNRLTLVKRSRMAGNKVLHILETCVRFHGLRPIPSAPQTFEVIFGPAMQ
ncbi:hypothetical protein BKA62DRAFT_73692 [Auriculariales sp. MPI-PUGE-AT-0066]|nr:hypothetical protein BKA62DRAFT_73692 [Auriculariales sp. MPI-PUGE-AT-0066]